MNTLPKYAGFTHLVREIGEGEWHAVDYGTYERATTDPTLDTTTIWHLLESVQSNADRFQKLINTPETEDFLKGIQLEAAHQEERWGASHDEGKEPTDWYWLIGHLAGKALMSFMRGDTEKAKHHVITTAAALANWHRKLCGSGTMRPGIEHPAYTEGSKAYVDGRSQLCNPYTSPKDSESAGQWVKGYHDAARSDTRKHG